MPAAISIVIPTLNEGKELTATLQALRSNSIAPCEIIVVDARSQDQTTALAQEFNCQVMTTPSPGRALQLNLGAKASQGDILLFLHGDTHVPPQGLADLQQALNNDGDLQGGAFSRRYASASLVLKITCLLADWRGSRLGLFLGDQGIFVRRHVFEQLKGFRNLAAFEDLDFCIRMKKLGKVTRLGSRVTSSARRFERLGPFITTFRDLKATWQFYKGRDINEILRELKE